MCFLSINQGFWKLDNLLVKNQAILKIQKNTKLMQMLKIWQADDSTDKIDEHHDAQGTVVLSCESEKKNVPAILTKYQILYYA